MIKACMPALAWRNVLQSFCTRHTYDAISRCCSLMLQGMGPATLRKRKDSGLFVCFRSPQ